MQEVAGSLVTCSTCMKNFASHHHQIYLRVLQPIHELLALVVAVHVVPLQLGCGEEVGQAVKQGRL